MSNLGLLRKNLGGYFLVPKDQTSLWKCDVVIPCLEKDLKVLDLNLRTIKKNLLHPIGEIFVVSPPSESICDCAKFHGCQWIDETEFLGFESRSIDYFPQGKDRRGWIFQQLIKLNSYKLGSSSWVLILDADTIFLRKQSFERNGVLLVQFSDENHFAYKSSLRRLIPELVLSDLSYVCHHFFLSKADLKEIVNSIEGKHSLPLPKAIITCMDLNEISGFSEYELLGNYIVNKYKQSIRIEYFRNAGMSIDEYSKVWKRLIFPLFFRTASFHQYN